ncbi:hypothetical protein [Shewanella surugensis]|uniref:DUF637 domain-containing protein n=1 Tax=Shewanella surugensis TaxID=212020 RepID=A0ABT0L646_9GAMM|nr:hypothetical protein [Shewanella surugensis]MCL1123039.1 hypothetical protein [Shewanella surugensis]
MSSVISIALNFIPGCQVWCSALFNAAMTYSMTGSLSAGLKVGIISAAVGYALQGIGEYFNELGNINQVAIDSGAWAKDAFVEFGSNMLTSGQAAAQIGAHAMVGGISAELQGGKFGHGFISAGVTKGAGGAFLPGGSDLKTHEVVGGAIISAAIGGTASALSGGLFVTENRANGARMGAMQYLLNQTGGSLKRRTIVTESVDGKDHRYQVRGLICSTSTAGCNGAYADKVFAHVNQNVVTL